VPTSPSPRARRPGTSAAPPLLVEVTRGGRVESVHRGVVVVVAPDGSPIASVGDPDTFAFLRGAEVKVAVALRGEVVDPEAPGDWQDVVRTATLLLAERV